MSETPQLDPERQAQARHYARLRRRLFVVDLMYSGLILAVWLAVGASALLKAWLLRLTSNPWLVTAGFGALFYLVFYGLSLPLSCYTGFHLPHRFGQSTQTLGGWAKDELLGLMLSAVIGLPLLLGLYWLLQAAGRLWWLWGAGAYILLAVVLVNLAPVLIMPLFNRYLPLGEEHAELVARLTALAQRAGTRVSGVFRFDLSRRTRAANAALTGLGHTRRIILGDTLLNEFTLDEVEVVIAHELGHHVNRDIPLGILFSSILTLAGLYLASLALDWGVATFGYSGPADIAALPWLALVLSLFNLALMPLGNAFSRWREVRADQYALESTGKPQAFADAMTRLANQNLAEADPEPWVVFLFYSHPPINERVAHARAFAQARQP